MTVGASGRGMQDAVAALYGVVVRPTASLCYISNNPAPYLAPSVAIFTAAAALGALPPLNVFGHYMSAIAWDVTPYALAMSFMNGLLAILGIFWVGRRWGGNRSLRRAFPALAYCMVPFMLGIVAVRAVWGLYALAVPETVFSDGLAAGFAYGDDIIQYAVGLLFIGWTLLLHVKAIRVLNGFGYARSAIILALSVLIVYAAGMAQSAATIAIYEFVP